MLGGSPKQRMQELAHGLELQACLSPDALTRPRRHFLPKPAQLYEFEFLLAHERQAPACLPEAGGRGGPRTGGQARVGHRMPSSANEKYVALPSPTMIWSRTLIPRILP